MVMSRRRGLVGAAGATLALGLGGRNSRAEGALPELRWVEAAPGKAAPVLRFRGEDGGEQGLEAFAGRGVVVNFWATWCVPCVEEMPALDALAAAVAAARVAVLPLSSDRGGAAAVRRFYEKAGVTGLPVLLDPMGAAARAAGARGLPTTVLIDAGGRERGRVEGAADWGGAAAVAMVKALAG